MACAPVLPPLQVVGIKSPERNGYWALQVGAGYRKLKSLDPTMAGFYLKQGVPFKHDMVEFTVSEDAVLPVGTHITAAHFVAGQHVDVQGVTKDKGFQGALRLLVGGQHVRWRRLLQDGLGYGACSMLTCRTGSQGLVGVKLGTAYQRHPQPAATSPAACPGVMKRWGFKGQPASHGVSLAHRAPGSIGNRKDPGRVWKGKKLPGHMGDEWRTVLNCLVYKVRAQLSLYG